MESILNSSEKREEILSEPSSERTHSGINLKQGFSTRIKKKFEI
jgi:hypothetical protein